MDIDEKRDITRKLLYGAGFRLGSLIVIRLLNIVKVIVFTRLFLPDEIGTATLAIACISTITVLGDFGFSQSVVRNRDNSSNFFADTAFTLSLILGLLLLFITIASAPLFAKIFPSNLDAFIRFLSVMVLSIPFQFPKVFWEKKIKFGHPSAMLMISEFCGLITTIVIQVTFHFGIWSLLTGSIAGFLMSSLYIWIFADNRPGIRLQHEHIKPIMHFGFPYMMQSLNGQLMAKGDNLLVGAYAGTVQLAYYDFAWQLPMFISSLTCAVDSMLFPVYARLNNNREAIIRLFNLTNKMWSVAGSFLGFPIILYADHIVYFLYGPKWAPVVPILQVMTGSFIIRFCTGYSYDNLVLVRGRTKYMAYWGFVNTFLIFTAGLYMIKTMGPIGGAWFWVLQAIILIPLVRFTLIYQELRSLEFLKHIWQPLVCGLLASLISYGLIKFLSMYNSTYLLISVASYFCTYLTLLFFLDHNLAQEIKIFISLAKGKPNGDNA